MKSRTSMLRLSVVAFVLVAAIAATYAVPVVRPVFATPLRFTSSSTQSSVEVILSNPNNFSVEGSLTLVVNQANGVTRTWPVGRILIPQGNSNRRVLIPGAITGVRWVRVTNVQIAP